MRAVFFCVILAVVAAEKQSAYAHKITHHGLNGKGSDLCPTGNGCGYCEIDGKDKWVNVAGPFVQSCLECKIEPGCTIICKCKDLFKEEDPDTVETDLKQFDVVETTYDLTDGCRKLGNDGNGHLYCYNSTQDEFWTLPMKLLAFLAFVAVAYVLYLRQKRQGASGNTSAAAASTEVVAVAPVANAGADSSKLPGSML